MTTVKNIYDYINSVAPFDKQEDWDNSGFILGEFRKEVKTVVLSLDGTKQAAEFAKSIDADLLLTHHPVIFKGVKRIEKGSAVYELIHNDIAVISAHTSFDKADGGINDNLAALLELENTEKISDDSLVVGVLKQAMSIDDFAQYAGEILVAHGLRYTDTDKLIKRVCIGGGACSEFMWDALGKADCFLTGDLKYHEMLDLKEAGLASISAGHFETENLPFLKLKERLEQIFTDVQFIIAPVENPIMEI
ncbi:MAG: Nif3-like dinuclear metal center hexameric protein [Eubacterium sp.]|nr:Nif3-like dinuclear metal center hexameric protein [Eubacterium sp.]MDE6155761.1 Nif3-like dinuclear metal center hexameric protein [Eubacterium sp.]